jgi:hypothetical protein
MESQPDPITLLVISIAFSALLPHTLCVASAGLVVKQPFRSKYAAVRGCFATASAEQYTCIDGTN